MCFSKYFCKLKLSLANDFNHFSLPELVYVLVSPCVRHAFSLPCFDDYMVFIGFVIAFQCDNSVLIVLRDAFRQQDMLDDWSE